MRLSTKLVALGIATILMPSIFAPKVSAIPLTLSKHFPSRADFVPIKLFVSWKFMKSPKEFACLDAIFTAESHWNAFAHNTEPVFMNGKRYFAKGIPQILGLTTNNPYKQVDAGIRYVSRRYGNACNALAFRDSHGWYQMSSAVMYVRFPDGEINGYPDWFIEEQKKWKEENKKIAKKKGYTMSINITGYAFWKDLKKGLVKV